MCTHKRKHKHSINIVCLALPKYYSFLQESVLGKERFEKQMSIARSLHSQSSRQGSVRSEIEPQTPILSRRRTRKESQLTSTLSLAESSSTTSKAVTIPGKFFASHAKVQS